MNLGDEVEVPVQMRYGGASVNLVARVVEVLTFCLEVLAFCLGQGSRGLPERLLEPCGWMSGSSGILIDLGFSIEVWDAVEMDLEVAAVAMKSYPQLRHVGERMELFQVEGKYHLVLAGPPC